jgi:hypothetical protein
MENLHMHLIDLWLKEIFQKNKISYSLPIGISQYWPENVEGQAHLNRLSV